MSALHLGARTGTGFFTLPRGGCLDSNTPRKGTPESDIGITGHSLARWVSDTVHLSSGCNEFNPVAVR